MTEKNRGIYLDKAVKAHFYMWPLVGLSSWPGVCEIRLVEETLDQAADATGKSRYRKEALSLLGQSCEGTSSLS